jgi:hypothetical protein
MESSIFNDDNDIIYIAELTHNNHENYDENNSESDENIDIINIQEEISSEQIRTNYRRRRGRGRGRGHNPNNSQSQSEQQLIQLPSPPLFNSFQHIKPLHEFTLKLPNIYQSSLLSPYLIFLLFFSSDQIKTIVQNTNVYAYSKKAGEGRKWEELTTGEFKIWIAILIYAGIFKLPSIEDYWNKDNKFPEHKITTFMTLLRFQQVLF